MNRFRPSRWLPYPSWFRTSNGRQAMLIAELSPPFDERPPANEAELLECLGKIGRGLIASGAAVGVVENTLTEIALRYDRHCEVIVLPNFLLIKLGKHLQARIEFAIQRLAIRLQLDQISEVIELIDQVMQKKVSLEDASGQFDRILAKPARFGPATTIPGYGLSCIGLTLLFRPELRSLVIVAMTGIVVGLTVWLFQKRPQFNLLLPVIAALVASTLIFNLTRMGYIYGSANLLVAPLITFLPGAVLTTGMIELASRHVISGSSRLMYGAALLMLLFVGISAGLNLSGLANSLVYAYEAVAFPWWAAPLGTLLFGIGTFIQLSGANRDLFWMLLVLYIAMVGQTIGEHYLNPYFGAFLGATLMALSSEFIARSPKRTAAVVSQALAFWFLVPGARGLLSVTSILSEDLQSAAIGLGEMTMLIIAITLGVLLGTLVISPQKFVPVTAVASYLDQKQA